jgi:hydrogenase nickel incorporation protein HypB
MCLDCGCSETGEVKIDGQKMEHHHDHDDTHHDHSHHTAGKSGREISIQRDILSKNNELAQHNREHLQAHKTFCMNWISAPGSGKTALLERIIQDYSTELPISVIEGDQQTDNDAQRIMKAGADAVQINTGAACHLDANMIHHALHRINLQQTRLLVIENVGNMVCPTAYDLGEDLKVAIISAPEGEDKPAKYPDLLLTANVLLINKVDLIPYLDFSLENCIALSKKVNPRIQIFPVSAKTGEGIPAFYDWLISQSVHLGSST